MQVGIIYKIRHKNIPSEFDCYGSTTQKMNERWYIHKSHYNYKRGNPSMHEYYDIYGFENFTMEFIEWFEFEHISELRQREQWFKDNFPNVNKINAWGRDKDKIRKRQKKFHEKNKEKLKEQWKEHKAEKIECECGCFTRRDYISTHRKSKKHTNLMATK